MKHRLLFLLPLAAGLLGLTACNYDFPLTEQPTRKIDPRLIGDWIAQDPHGGPAEPLSIRRLDAHTYVAATEGGIYRITHTDIPGASLVSVQDLQPGMSHGRFAYYDWSLGADSRQLTIRLLRTSVVPEDTPDAAAAQRLIRDNLANPALFGDPIVLTPKAP